MEAMASPTAATPGRSVATSSTRPTGGDCESDARPAAAPPRRRSGGVGAEGEPRDGGQALPDDVGAGAGEHGDVELVAEVQHSEGPDAALRPSRRGRT